MSEAPLNFGANNTPEVAAPPQPPIPPAIPVAPAVQPPAPAVPAAQTATTAIPAPYAAQPMAHAGVPVPGAPAFQALTAAKSFFGRLFDMSFSTYIAPSVVKLMYILSLIAIWGGWLVALIMGTISAGEWDASDGFIAFFVIFVLGGLAAFSCTLITRASLEFLIATIKTAENTNRLRELKEVENQ